MRRCNPRGQTGWRWTRARRAHLARLRETCDRRRAPHHARRRAEAARCRMVRRSDRRGRLHHSSICFLQPRSRRIRRSAAGLLNTRSDDAISIASPSIVAGPGQANESSRPCGQRIIPVPKGPMKIAHRFSGGRESPEPCKSPRDARQRVLDPRCQTSQQSFTLEGRWPS